MNLVTKCLTLSAVALFFTAPSFATIAGCPVFPKTKVFQIANGRTLELKSEVKSGPHGQMLCYSDEIKNTNPHFPAYSIIKGCASNEGEPSVAPNHQSTNGKIYFAYRILKCGGNALEMTEFYNGTMPKGMNSFTTLTQVAGGLSFEKRCYMDEKHRTNDACSSTPATPKTFLPEVL